MRTRAAVLRKGGEPWEITELDLDEPKAGEVLIRFEAAGLCHSDEHIRATGTDRLPLVGGHEGAGVIEAVGPGVTRVTTGDRVACSYIPVCGTCRYCSTGHQNLCDAGQNAGIGCLVDGTFRFHDGQQDLGGMCVLGTFSQYAVLSEWSCVRSMTTSRSSSADDHHYRHRRLRHLAARQHPLATDRRHEARCSARPTAVPFPGLCRRRQLTELITRRYTLTVNVTGRDGREHPRRHPAALK